MLTRKHFKVIAEMINDLTRDMEPQQRQRKVVELAADVKVMSDNPNFDRQRFIDACLMEVTR